MQFSYAFVAMAAIAGLANSESSSSYGMLSCAQPCIEDSVAKNTKCGAADIACQCLPENVAAIGNGAASCLLQSCPNDLSTVAEAGEAICKSLQSASSTAASKTSVASSSMSEPPSVPTPTPQPVTYTHHNTTNATSTSTPVHYTGAAGHAVVSLGSAIGFAIAAVIAL